MSLRGARFKKRHFVVSNRHINGISAPLEEHFSDELDEQLRSFFAARRREGICELHPHCFSIARTNKTHCCDDLLLLFLKYIVPFPLWPEPAGGMSYILHWWRGGEGGGGAGSIVPLLTKTATGVVNEYIDKHDIHLPNCIKIRLLYVVRQIYWDKWNVLQYHILITCSECFFFFLWKNCSMFHMNISKSGEKGKICLHPYKLLCGAVLVLNATAIVLTHLRWQC